MTSVHIAKLDRATKVVDANEAFQQRAAEYSETVRKQMTRKKEDN